jgi:hypothetical protein
MELGIGSHITELNIELIKKQNISYWSMNVLEIVRFYGKNEICIPLSDSGLQSLFAWRRSFILEFLGTVPWSMILNRIIICNIQEMKIPLHTNFKLCKMWSFRASKCAQIFSGCYVSAEQRTNISSPSDSTRSLKRWFLTQNWHGSSPKKISHNIKSVPFNFLLALLRSYQLESGTLACKLFQDEKICRWDTDSLTDFRRSLMTHSLL